MYMFVCIIMHFRWCHFDYIRLQSIHASISRMAYGYETRHKAKTSLYRRKSCIKTSGHNIQLKIYNICNALVIKQSSVFISCW